MSKKDVDHGRPRIVCTRMKEAKFCDNRRAYYLDEIERTVVGGIRHELGAPDALAYFIRCYNEEKRRTACNSDEQRQTLKVQISAVEQQIERGVAAIIQGRITETEAEIHLPSLRERLRILSTELAATAADPIMVKLQPKALSDYLSDLERLEHLVNADLAAGDAGAARVIRDMIQSVTVEPTSTGSEPGIIVRGELGSLLAPGLVPSGVLVGGGGGAG